MKGDGGGCGPEIHSGALSLPDARKQTVSTALRAVKIRSGATQDPSDIRRGFPGTTNAAQDFRKRAFINSTSGYPRLRRKPYSRTTTTKALDEI